jgi:hypothetical protein
MIAPTKHLSPADEAYGYEIGEAGMVDLAEARSILGGVSRTTIWRLSKKGIIRSSKILGSKRYCRRSLLNYLKPNETTGV